MPWLVSLFAAAVLEVFKFAVKLFTKKTAITLGYIGTFLLFFGLFVAVLEGLLAGLSYYTPDGFDLACSWFIPSNFSACLSAIMAAKIARFAWDLTLTKIDMMYRMY